MHPYLTSDVLGVKMKKATFYTELAYILGLLVLAFGTALMERSDFGVSMVVAPAYLLHLKVSEFLPFFSFGMAEYTFQALLLVITMLILRRVRFSYFFSLVTAVIYGFMLDGFMLLVDYIGEVGTVTNVVIYVIGMMLCASGISLLFHTYISPEAYELFVKEITGKYNLDIHKVKTAYDCASCLLSIVMSFAFFGLWHFEGIKWGTAVCALANGTLIAIWTRIYERFFVFKDGLRLKKFFS